MGGFLYDMANNIFGSKLASEIQEDIDVVFTKLGNILVDPTYAPFINALMGIGALLMMLYFFQSIIDQASRDMFSFEKLIVAFIKMIVAFSIMIYLPELLGLVVKFGKVFSSWMLTDLGSVSPIEASGNADAYKDHFNHFTKILETLACLFGMLIPWIICLFCGLMAKFIVYSNGIMLGVRMVFSPLAVAQLFEDGSRSSGMKYLKGLFADALSFSLILMLVFVANYFVADIGGSSAIPPATELQSKLGWADLVPNVITKLVIAGGMASVSKIAHDVVGA